ncbi:hypothetical protein K1719_011865 [Acacia pycnantha]|nr:hypothetical protein K1719_011865 [Acacia pycnantha]
MAKRRMRANFECLNKLGVDWWCFHDRDIAPDGKTLEEAKANLDEVAPLPVNSRKRIILGIVITCVDTSVIEGNYDMTNNKKALWGTAQLFMHPRYMHGAATCSELGGYAYAAAQVKKAMEVTHYLGLNHLARFLEAAVAYKKKIGFNGTLLIEPKPQEPTKHQLPLFVIIYRIFANFGSDSLSLIVEASCSGWRCFEHASLIVSIIIRGSIPLLWDQIVDLTYKPKYELVRLEEAPLVMERHFLHLRKKYGAVIAGEY